jgi:hypothetical protein
VRRITVALVLLGFLTSACGGSDLPTGVAATLQDQVAVIRHDAEIGRPGHARNHLRELVAMVTSQLERGVIDEQRATEILSAAGAVATRLSLLPGPSPAESPSPPPVEETGKGKGNGKGKDHDNGNGNGND